MSSGGNQPSLQAQLQQKSSVAREAEVLDPEQWWKCLEEARTKNLL